MMLTEAGLNKPSLVTGMKVKMFSGNDLSHTEASLNEWLKENRVKVHHIGQSQCERNGNLLLAISVFYTLQSNN